MLFLVLFASFLQFSETNMNAPVEQPNAWSHPRDIIIKFPGSQFEPEQSVGFRVEQSGSVEFSKILSEYFYFCASREATVKVSNEVSDVESKQPCSMIVEIYGVRNVVGQEMQRIGNNLTKHSTRFR